MCKMTLIRFILKLVTGSILLALGLLLGLFPSHAFDREKTNSVRIGIIVSIDTGPGKGNLAGAKLALDNINAAGGVKGKPIEFVVKDDENKPQKALEHAVELTRDPSIVILMGTTFSETTLPIAPYIEKSGKILVTPYIGHDDVTKGKQYIFRPVFTTRTQGETMAQFIYHDLGLHEAVLFRDTSSEYSQSLCRIFQDVFTGLGGKIVQEVVYDTSVLDFSRYLAQRNWDAARVAIYIPGHDFDIVRLVRTLHRLNLQPTLIGAATMGSVTILNALGGSLDSTYYTASYHLSLNTPGNKKFVEQYKNRYGEFPQSWSAAWYDAVNLVADVLNGSEQWDRDSLRKTFLKVDFQGVSGRLHFQENGNGIRDMLIMKVEKGIPKVYKIIKPES